MKINWSQALLKYVTDTSQSFRDIASSFKVNRKAVEIRAKKENWVKLREETQTRFRQKLPEKVSDEIIKTTQQHNALGKMFIAKGVSSIQEKQLEPDKWDEAKESIKDGIEIQRRALKIEDMKPPVAIQINFTNPEIEDWAK